MPDREDVRCTYAISGNTLTMTFVEDGEETYQMPFTKMGGINPVKP
jgi:hypothetical protein